MLIHRCHASHYHHCRFMLLILDIPTKKESITGAIYHTSGPISSAKATSTRSGGAPDGPFFPLLTRTPPVACDDTRQRKSSQSAQLL